MSPRMMVVRVLSLAVVLIAGPALSQMGGGMLQGGMANEGRGGVMQGSMCPMCQAMGGGMMPGDCMATLSQLGLESNALAALQDAHFELQKTAIRKGADLKILQMELHRFVDNQDFDLDAARKKARAIADLQAELHAAHLGFLHQLAGKLSGEQWQKFQEWRKHKMMEGMGGASGGKHAGPDQGESGKGKMGGGMMDAGGMMKGGMMHREGMQQ